MKAVVNIVKDPVVWGGLLEDVSTDPNGWWSWGNYPLARVREDGRQLVVFSGQGDEVEVEDLGDKLRVKIQSRRHVLRDWTGFIGGVVDSLGLFWGGEPTALALSARVESYSTSEPDLEWYE